MILSVHLCNRLSLLKAMLLFLFSQCNEPRWILEGLYNAGAVNRPTSWKRRVGMCWYTRSSGWFAEYRHLRSIATERGNFSLDPLQRHHLIEHTQVSRKVGSVGRKETWVINYQSQTAIREFPKLVDFELWEDRISIIYVFVPSQKKTGTWFACV